MVVIGSFNFIGEWIKDNSTYEMPDYTRIHGNDKESIVKLIYSFEEYENKAIEILEIKNVDDMRFTSFLADGYPSGVRFDKNKDGNYAYTRIMLNPSEPLQVFAYTRPNWFIVVTNNENEIEKIQETVNGQTYEIEVVLNKVGVTWVELPKSKDDHYSITIMPQKEI